MQDPILRELRRIRARYLKEMRADMHRSAAKSNEVLDRLCDVVISPTGERHFVLSATKINDALIAPLRIAKG
jgi:glutamyl-tRNA reductase